jgi:hypothetical protein
VHTEYQYKIPKTQLFHKKNIVNSRGQPIITGKCLKFGLKAQRWKVFAVGKDQESRGLSVWIQTRPRGSWL